MTDSSGTRRLALVTALYDLVRRGSAGHRHVDWLFANGDFVLGLDRELVIFTDPDLETALRARRGDLPTKIVAVPFEELLGQERLDASRRGRVQDNVCRTKVTPAYVQLMWAKYAMLEAALAVTSASHLGWIDLAITHVAKPPPDGVDIFADPSDRVRVHVLRMFSRLDVGRPDYWRSVRGHLAGGLLVGARESMRELVNEFWRAVDRATSMGLVPLDEGLLSYVVGQRPGDFSYSYGDYEDILRNHDESRGGEVHRRWIVTDALSRGLPEAMDLPARRARHTYSSDQGRVQVVGFPAVILAEEASSVVPGHHERDLIDWVLQFAPLDKQFVDCAAHVGSWTLILATCFREVHAFEPRRLIFQQLCGNVVLSGLTNVFAHNVRLGTEFRRSMPPQELRGSEMEAVAALDDFVDVLGDVGLLKINVEGPELRVLRGATEVLRRNGLPKLLLGCWSRNWYEQGGETLPSFLEGLGYRVVAIAGYEDKLLAEKK